MSPAVLSFEDSGKGSEVLAKLTLPLIQQLCIDCGFEKKGSDPSKPLAQRADMEGFFKVIGVNSVSQFKPKFASTKLERPTLDQLQAILASENEPKKKKPAAPAARPAAGSSSFAQSVPVPSVSEYKTLAASFESSLKWRMIPRPGGASTKPEDFYTLYGAKMQAEEGDNNTEKPMWAETGGLDFDGRDRWEAWGRHKGLSSDEAKLAFCTAYARAMGREADNFRKY